MIRFIAPALFLSVVAAGQPKPPPLARLISIEVELDGQVVLRGSSSDAGRQNVDEVWRMVTSCVHERSYSTTLYPTKDFKKELLTHVTDNQYTLRGRNGKNKPVLRVRYGGQVSVKELRLTRVEAARRIGGVQARNWCLDAAQLKSLFANRLISRRDAANIQDVANTKF